MWLKRSAGLNTGYGQRLWPVFALLTAVVVLPTAGVLWFMNQAMQNEQFAVRQRLMEAYRAQLQSAAGRVRSEWSKKLARITEEQKRARAPEAFAELVRAGVLYSAHFYEKGNLKYPDPAALPDVTAEPGTALWLEARRLEYEKNDPRSAGEVYRRIIIQSSGDRESALAFLAQARCLNKSGRPQQAVELLLRTFGGDRYLKTTDPQGRLIHPNALLFALELMKEPSHPLFRKTAALLAGRLNDYRAPVLPSGQRRFLMQRLQGLWPECPSFPTQVAEEMAAAYKRESADRLRQGQLQPGSLKDVWAYQTQDKSLVALFKKDQLLEFMRAAVEADGSIPGIRFSVLAPGISRPAFLAEDIGDTLPSWRLALDLDEPDPFESATNQKITAYVWTGILMTVGIVFLSILIAVYLRRQVRLTRLKNDLIANVSHELKTPLASMRLLVDTLRDGHCQDSQLLQEYLQMISKENARLSSLIEEFLTFSRMERNKAKFDKSVLRTDEIIHAAVEAIGERLQAPGCHLDLDLAPQLPGVVGDRDALVTVLVNLLDNALKYSGDEKNIRLRGFASDGRVCLEVQDNGIGFPRGAANKIFDRFYQVDRTLSRRTGGCGLGLSIVKFIVDAHDGSITAKSQPGKGSTFTVQLPAA